MHSTNVLGGEGASTPIYHSSVISTPSVVVWPVFTPGSMTVEAFQEIYLLAYEQAQAVLRPSRYELANRYVSN